MTMPEEIAVYLNDNGFGKYDPDGVCDIFIGTIPEYCPCISLFQYAGRQSVMKQLGGTEIPGLQVCVKDAEYIAGLKTINEICNFLDQTDPTINGTYYPYIRAKQRPFLLQRDENENYIFAVNFEVYRNN